MKLSFLYLRPWLFSTAHLFH